jgi:hypothetical protein
MLPDGMRYAATRKMRMKRKIATAPASDVSDERLSTGVFFGLCPRAAATTFRDAVERDGRFFAATAVW